jgi:hypothetical protein
MGVGVGEVWGIGVSVAAETAAVGLGSAPRGCSTGPHAIKKIPAKSIRIPQFSECRSEKIVFKISHTYPVDVLQGASLAGFTSQARPEFFYFTIIISP